MPSSPRRHYHHLHSHVTTITFAPPSSRHPPNLLQSEHHLLSPLGPTPFATPIYNTSPPLLHLLGRAVPFSVRAVLVICIYASCAATSREV
ncbi:hypothetical protein Tco_1262304 [Tanacetum coccineum]